MLKRGLNGKTLGALCMLVMSAFLTLFAAVRSDAWTVNPSEYRYDMSLYFSMSSKDYVNLDKYEIGAFIGDECRGLAEKVDLPDGADCMLLRIRSNSTAEGQEVVFKMRDRETDEVVILKGKDGEPFTFKADQTVGLPSAPYILTPYYNVTVKAGAHGTVDFENGMYAEGTVLNLNAVAAEGYHFDSWSDGDKEAERSITVTGNIELTASFSVSSYILTFVIDGDIVETLTLEYGATVTAPSVPEKEGYTFSGWQNLPSKMPAQDIEVTGSYTINSYNAVFKIDGAVIATLTFEYGAEVIAPEAPEKEGYTFSGWQDVPNIMPSRNIEVTGSYTINSYNVIFKAGDEIISSKTLEYGSPIEIPEAPEKEGYTFDGWQDVPKTVPAHDVEILGTYTVNSYTATFYIESDVIATISVDYGTVIPSPEAPVREGYTFDGWLDVPETMPAHDIEIEGSYTLNSYKATFILDGVIFETVNIDYGTPVKGPRVPDKEGYVFSGWQNLPETMPAHDIEVTGTYDVKKYKAVFKLDGEVFETLNLAYGEAIKAPAAPEKEGYTFGGWQNLPATMPARDIEITGSYTINSYKAVFMLDGEIFETLNVEYGAAVNAPAAPEKEGYTFGGWQNLPATMPARDIEITGSYTINSYKAVFMLDGEVFETLNIEYGAAVNAPAAPEKEGYTFSGWTDVPETMPAHDIEISGSYTVNSYTAVFKVDGNVLETLSVEYGAVINAPAAPEKEGYTFAEWAGLPAVMPAHDIETEAVYTLNSYKAVFMLDGEIFETLNIEYGAAIKAPAAPEKEGYTFDGWTDVPETMPAHDIEISGSYTVNSYSVVFKVDGNVLETLSVEYGAAIEAPAAPEKEGYTFAEWAGLPAVMPAHDIETEAVYTLNSYKAVFMLDGEIFETLNLAYGEAIKAPAAPEKEGYTFGGWTDVPETMPDHDIVVEGSYTVNSYQVIFVIDGEMIATLSVEYGAVINAPAAPEKEDYTFDGWKDLPETMPAQDLVITGSYTYSPDIFHAVFMIDGETVVTITVEAGDPIELPEAPVKEGYTFAGWQDVPETMPHHDVVINGSYTVNSYKVTFIIDGEVIDTLTVEYGAVINAPAAPEKEDYTFTGWENLPETMPAHDIEVTGTYVDSDGKYNAVFMIDGETVATILVEGGTAIELPEAPAKEGYTFAGWQDVPETMPHHDVVINGSYTVNSYDVLFVVNGETIETRTVEYGTVIEAPEMPEREGYTFSGWLNLPETMPAQSIEIVGNYHPNLYTATFIIDGEVLENVSVEYGSLIPVPIVPEKDDYTFSGWSNLPETMPAHDIEVTGSYIYSPDLFKAVFVIDGEIFETLTLEPGNAINAPVAPEKEGYTFAGWQDVPATMPHHDVVIMGSYTVNSYNAVFIIDGVVIETLSVEYGAVINVPAAPEKEDYTFDGWKDVPETMPARDIEITGSYTYSPDIFQAVFMIDGEIYATIHVECGDPVELPAEPFREGYTFSGWQDIPEEMPHHDVVITGSFTVNTYTVVFMIGDEVIDTRRVDYGAAIETPEVSEKEGYTFEGWTGVPATMPATDLVISGNYKANLYRLLIYLDGSVYLDEQLAYGTEIVVPEPEVPDGMQFDGWDIELPETMPAHDVIVYGTLSVLSVIDSIAAESNDSLTIYDLNGALLFKGAKASEVKDQLTPGVYIINGQKVMVK